MARQVLLVHQGDRNWKVAGIGVAIATVGVLLMTGGVAFGTLLLVVGLVTAVVGLQKTGRRCPSCRTKVSRRARMCPQCQQPTGFAA